jgi:hypothetical protein
MSLSLETNHLYHLENNLLKVVRSASSYKGLHTLFVAYWLAELGIFACSANAGRFGPHRRTLLVARS